MKILISSQSFVVRESLENLFYSLFNYSTIYVLSNANTIKRHHATDLDLAFIEIKNNSEVAINKIKAMKGISKNIRIMILDSNNSKSTFQQAIKLDVEGYLNDLIDKEEFIFSINKIMEGKKVYASEMVQHIVNNEVKNLNSLSKREQEVLKELGKGLNNKKISEKLFITEYTVKKHVSNILDKLNLKNRQEAIIYVTQNS